VTEPLRTNPLGWLIAAAAVALVVWIALRWP